MPKGVAQDVKRENGDSDHQAGEGGNPGGDPEDFPALVEDGAPGWVRRLNPETEVAKARLDEDRRRNV